MTLPPAQPALPEDPRRPPSLRQVGLVLGGVVAVLAALVLPSQSFQSAWNDWRHTADLGGAVREVDGPLELRTQASTVALGDGRVMVWGGRGVTADSGAVHDPATGTWEDLPPAPGPGRGAAAAAWTGEEAVFVGGTRGSGAADAVTATAWNPATRQWRTLPDAPVPLVGARAVSFADGLLVAGGDRGVSPSTPVSLWLDRRSGAWTEIPTPLQVLTTTWLGDRLLATGPPAESPGGPSASGWAVVAFDPATLTWAPYADPLETGWMALAASRDGVLSAVSLDGLNEPLRAWTWSGSAWEQVAETSRGAGSIATIEPVGYPPVAVQAGGRLLLGGMGGLTGWDPDAQEFAVLVDQRVRTFGGSAVWTGRELVALSHQTGEGWIWTPR